jgi:hypothetical protein
MRRWRIRRRRRRQTSRKCDVTFVAGLSELRGRWKKRNRRRRRCSGVGLLTGANQVRELKKMSKFIVLHEQGYLQ